MTLRPARGGESIQFDDAGESPMQAELRTARPNGRARRRAAFHRLGARLTSAVRSDRGDVPGWVLITLMTAGLVIALWAVAGPALTTVFVDAIARVTGQIGG